MSPLKMDLERQLLRKGVGALTRARHCCADCGRTPLAGEQVHVYADAVVCTLCRPRHREDPERTERARICDDRGSVRLRAA
jgi:hypothetical protein